MTCFDRYAAKYPAFFAEMRSDIEAYLQTGTMPRATALSEATGHHFNARHIPMFFNGDLDAQVVMVYLNPKDSDDRLGGPEPEVLGRNFAEHIELQRIHGSDFFLNSPAPTYGKLGNPFDHKQVRFLRSLGAMEFLEETSREAKYINIGRALAWKLQMELIPYGSPNFETWRLSKDVLLPHFDRILDVIATTPRRYVLFCGKAFEPLVDDFIVEHHRFRLTKTDGATERAESRFSVLEIPFRGQRITAGLASSWARQGIPMRSYGEKIRELYPSSS